MRNDFSIGNLKHVNKINHCRLRLNPHLHWLLWHRVAVAVDRSVCWIEEKIRGKWAQVWIVFIKFICHQKLSKLQLKCVTLEVTPSHHTPTLGILIFGCLIWCTRAEREIVFYFLLSCLSELKDSGPGLSPRVSPDISQVIKVPLLGEVSSSDTAFEKVC